MRQGVFKDTWITHPVNGKGGIQMFRMQMLSGPDLLVLLLVPVLSETLLALVGGYLMSFSFLTAGHVREFVMIMMLCQCH
jgi:hypothetical protein